MTSVENPRNAVAAKPVITDEQLKAAEKLIEKEEGATNRVGGWIGSAVAWFAVFVTLFHLYAAIAGSWPLTAAPIVPTYLLRPLHVGMVLVLVFMLYPLIPRLRDRITVLDWILAVASAVVIAYVIMQGDEFGDRSTSPEQLDVIVGVVFVALVLEATRRTTGMIMPGVALLFIAYAMLGNQLPAPWTHRGYTPDRLIGHLYMTLEGIFGTAVDVSSSLIILFTIFGAILQQSGAGKFFIDFSFAAMGGRRSSAGRAVVMSSFLMGGPSGSGVATTVTIGTVAYPLLAKAGYEKNAAGGLLAAGGLGAIISPPVLGAAAFLIAEYLKIDYLAVITMATIPTLLYYFGIWVMVELDSAKYGGGAERLVVAGGLWDLTKKYWFHFGSLISIIAFMLLGFSPTLSVVWATVLAAVTSFLRRDTALMPAKMKRALIDGTTGVLSIAPTCAAAGIIVGVATLTGLAGRFADIVVAAAGGSLLLTTLYTAAIVWVVGLAVPVTASYILSIVVAAPALTKLGVPDFAAHMFVFYYAVLSEVSPPTALSPFAAAAITGGNPYMTTLQTWKYTMPAFLVPFVFVLDPLGLGLLMKVPKGGSWLDIVYIAVVTFAGISALGVAFQGWLFKRSNWLETVLFLAAGLLLVFPLLVDGALRAFAGLQLNYAVPLALMLAGAGAALQRVRSG